MDYSKGVDFDWDLSDKTDTETQTHRGTNDPHVGPADAIVQVFLFKSIQTTSIKCLPPLQLDIGMNFMFVQTDQRIVFHNSKAVRFIKGSGEKSPTARKKSSASQTRWELKDKEVQVDLVLKLRD